MPGKILGSEELAGLAAYLRNQNFAVGAAQLVAAQRLLWRMAERGISNPAAEMGSWLGPIFATNPRDLERFAVLYDQWQTVRPTPPPRPPPKRHWFLIWFVSSVLLAALAAGWWLYGHRPKPPSGDQAGKSEPPQTKGDSSFSLNGIATAAGTLLGSDGKPVPHARLLVPPNNSVESDASGRFFITGKSSDPVLATHCDYDAVLFPLINRDDYSLTMVRKPQSACTPGGSSPVPKDVRPDYQRKRLAVSLLPMLAFLLWTTYVLWKRVGLKKWRGAASSQFAQIPLDDSADRLFSDTALQRSVQELRRPRPIPLREIWPEPTVSATVENAGWFTPIYRVGRRAAEYLVLIDRTGKRDQQARFADELLEQLQKRGVFADVYHFHSDPRTCTEAKTGRSIAITDLSARYGQCQVWVVADGTTFFNALSGRLERWVDAFQQWPTRVLLTTASPSDWGDRELRLADFGFEIVLASPRGLARILEHVATPHLAIDSYPPLLEDSPLRWADSHSPTAREITRLCTELRLYLGRDGFRWLVACAEYPLIEWPLTLYLGNALMEPGTLEPLLRKLVRLPWFRRGSIPSWLRKALLRTDRSLRKRVLHLLADRLNAMPPLSAPSRASDLDVAIERDYRRRVEEDEIWLSLLWGRDPDSLASSSSGLRRLLFHRGRIWLGPRAAVLFILALLSSAGIWWGMRFGIPTYTPPEPQIERIALDIALSQQRDPSYYLASYDSNPAVSFPVWCYQVTRLLLGRDISLVPAAPGTQPIAGAISGGKGNDGIVAGGGWSLVFDGGHIVAQKGYSLYKLAEFSNEAPVFSVPAELRITQDKVIVPPAPSHTATESSPASSSFSSNTSINGSSPSKTTAGLTNTTKPAGVPLIPRANSVPQAVAPSPPVTSGFETVDATESYYRQKVTYDQRAYGKTAPQVAADLRNLSTFYQNLQQYQNAEPPLLQALELDRSTGDKSAELRDLSSLGSLNVKLGRYSDAKRLYQEALSLAQASADLSSEQELLNNLGSVYVNEMYFDKAKELYSRALSIGEKTSKGYSLQVVDSLVGLASLYAAQENYGEAEVLYRRILAMDQSAPQRSGSIIASHLRALSGIVQIEGRDSEAKQLLERAVEAEARGRAAQGAGGQPVALTGGRRLNPLNCQERSSLKSHNDNQSTVVQFVNLTSTLAHVYWIDFDGQEQSYYDMPAHSVATVDTYVTHPWVIRDASGNCLEIFLPIDKPASAEITRSE